MARATDGAPEGLWLRANAQDGGRGRMGRRWSSEPGNVYASTIVRLRTTDPPAATLAFVAALAAAECVTQIAPVVPLTIKWPNDLLSGGAKLCGMLLERSGDAVVIGFGINLVSHPQLPDRPATDLKALGAQPPHPQAVVEILADCLAIWIDRWRMGGMRGIAQQWQRQAHPAGSAMNIALPDGESLVGLFQGLSEDGALRLRLADGTIRAIHAGDVFLI